jgi:hypothetical protein
MTQAKATFEVSSWQEETYADLDGDTKLTRANWVQTFSGDLEGDQSVGCLMYYRADGKVRTVTQASFVGTVRGRSGSFVSQATGSYANGEAKSSFSVIAGSGAGALEGLRGKGKTAIGGDGKGSLTFEYELG